MIFKEFFHYKENSSVEANVLPGDAPINATGEVSKLAGEIKIDVPSIDKAEYLFKTYKGLDHYKPWINNIKDNPSFGDAMNNLVSAYCWSDKVNDPSRRVSYEAIKKDSESFNEFEHRAKRVFDGLIYDEMRKIFKDNNTLNVYGIKPILFGDKKLEKLKANISKEDYEKLFSESYKKLKKISDEHPIIFNHMTQLLSKDTIRTLLYYTLLNYTQEDIDKLGIIAKDKSKPCSRCGGSGFIPSYSKVNGGVCFKCNGSGV